MSNLSAFIAGFAEAEPMPLFHNTSSYSFREISQAASPDLIPTHCPVFDQKLLYFFYGRPAYRVTDSESDNIGYLPVCFLIKPDAIMSVERVFPFDTGAFHHDRFAPYVHEKMAKEDFQLGNDISAAQKAISALFGSGRQYYIGHLSDKLAPKFSEMELLTYVQIVSRPPASVVDDRRYSIEIQTQSSLSLIGNTLAVVLPYEAMDDPTIRTFIVNKLGAHPITYQSYWGIRPSDFHGEIRVLVQQFLEQRRYL